MKRTSLLITSLFMLAFSLSIITPVKAQQCGLQGFWWNYWNSNYPDAWANYLADLAPRLSEIGIDAVWVPVPLKADGGTSNNGYTPFDQYDLGDKFQKGNARTRSGNKDELLRMIAVMHSNNIQVISDVVINHASGAESDDPKAWDGQWKNFRNACYETPYDANNKTGLKGRFPKNWQNFHRNPGHNFGDNEWGDWTSGWWGPDFCFYEGAYGQSSNATYNPTQTANYVRNNMRDWFVWYRKQTNFDGFRFDAVKHFPNYVLADYLWNVMYNAGWASMGANIFSVGEYVGGVSELDNFVNSTEQRCGTFDFSLRYELKSVGSSQGAYWMGDLPGKQQGVRVVYQDNKWVHRTSPFVNNHDTFRPTLDKDGNYTGWDGGNEIGGHMEPNDPRMPAAYAVALSMDGSPMVYFEDLFNIGYMKNRFTHDPKDPTKLPYWSDIANLTWCHHNLGFKEAAYAVRHSGGDLLVIERVGKAIIGASDSWSSWQSQWVKTGFAAGTKLVDYSEASNHTITVNADGWVEIAVPPCNGTAAKGRRGYAVWAPAGITAKVRPIIRTTQEWEMAQDLGDSHPSSLGQGGALPANSTDWRLVNSINVRAGEKIEYFVHPGVGTGGVTIEFYDYGTNCVVHTDSSEEGDVNGSFTPTCSRWLRTRIKHTNATAPEEKCWVKIAYAAPKHGTDGYDKTCDCETGVSIEEQQLANTIDINPNPTTADNLIVTIHAVKEQETLIEVYDMRGSLVFSQTAQIEAGTNAIKLTPENTLAKGLYTVKIAEFDLYKNVVIE